MDELHEAARDGDLGRVEQLISQLYEMTPGGRGQAVTIRQGIAQIDALGRTAAEVAMHAGHFKVVSRLMEAERDESDMVEHRLDMLEIQLDCQACEAMRLVTLQSALKADMEVQRAILAREIELVEVSAYRHVSATDVTVGDQIEEVEHVALSNFSADLLTEIFLHLELFDVVNAFQVNKAFHALESCDDIWKELYLCTRRRKDRVLWCPGQVGVLEGITSWKARFCINYYFRGHDDEFDSGVDELINEEYEFYVDAVKSVSTGRGSGYTERLPMGQFQVDSIPITRENYTAYIQLCLTDHGLGSKSYTGNEQLIANVNEARRSGRLQGRELTWKQYIVYVRRKVDGAFSELLRIDGSHYHGESYMSMVPGAAEPDTEDGNMWNEYVSNHGAGGRLIRCATTVELSWAERETMLDRGILNTRIIGAEVIFAMPNDVHDRETEVDRIRSTHIRLHYLSEHEQVSGHWDSDGGPPNDPFDTHSLYHALKSSAMKWYLPNGRRAREPL